MVDRSPQSVTIRSEQFKNLMEAAKIWNVNGMEIIPADVIVDKSRSTGERQGEDQAEHRNAAGEDGDGNAGSVATAGMPPPGMPPPNGGMPQ